MSFSSPDARPATVIEYERDPGGADAGTSVLTVAGCRVIPPPRLHEARGHGCAVLQLRVDHQVGRGRGRRTRRRRRGGSDRRFVVGGACLPQRVVVGREGSIRRQREPEDEPIRARRNVGSGRDRLLPGRGGGVASEVAPVGPPGGRVAEHRHADRGRGGVPDAELVGAAGRHRRRARCALALQQLAIAVLVADERDREGS